MANEEARKSYHWDDFPTDNEDSDVSTYRRHTHKHIHTNTHTHTLMCFVLQEIRSPRAEVSRRHSESISYEELQELQEKAEKLEKIEKLLTGKSTKKKEVTC